VDAFPDAEYSVHGTTPIKIVQLNMIIKAAYRHLPTFNNFLYWATAERSPRI